MSDMLDPHARWMAAEEDEHLEFKEASQRSDFELLVKYCCAFANEGGDRIILGVSDQRPRRERLGRGRGVRYLLAPRYYKAIGKSGAYTRKRGLDRNTNKALLLKHVKNAGRTGCPLSELQDVLPSLSRAQVQTLLREMKRDGIVHPVGLTRAGRWFVGPSDEGDAS